MTEDIILNVGEKRLKSQFYFPFKNGSKEKKTITWYKHLFIWNSMKVTCTHTLTCTKTANTILVVWDSNAGKTLTDGMHSNLCSVLCSVEVW